MTDTIEAVIVAASSDLLRFGFVLTGDGERSRSLVLSTLSSLDWRRLRGAGDPVAQVRRAMAREYAGWRDDEVAGQSVSSSAVGDALGVLTPRQRAVTALRYGENLFDADAARALGAKVGTVKSDASLALSQMRASFPDDERPDATELAQDLRAFFAAAVPGQVGGGLSIAEVARCARTARRRRAAHMGAVAAAATVVVVGAVAAIMSIDDPDTTPANVAASATPEPTVFVMGEVDTTELALLTPEEFSGLSIGMTVDEVTAVLGEDAVFRDNVPGLHCDLQMEVGTELRGWFQQWPVREDGAEPSADAELVLTEVAYYGNDAKTVAEFAVGMRMQDALESTVEMVQTPIGDGVHTVYQPLDPSASWGIVGGIGYRAWPPICNVGMMIGEGIE